MCALILCVCVCVSVHAHIKAHLHTYDGAHASAKTKNRHIRTQEQRRDDTTTERTEQQLDGTAIPSDKTNKQSNGLAPSIQRHQSRIHTVKVLAQLYSLLTVWEMFNV